MCAHSAVQRGWQQQGNNCNTSRDVAVLPTSFLHALSGAELQLDQRWLCISIVIGPDLEASQRATLTLAIGQTRSRYQYQPTNLTQPSSNPHGSTEIGGLHTCERVGEALCISCSV